MVRAVEKALAKRPEDRFADVSAFIAALTGTPLRTLTPPPDAPRLAPVQAVPQGPTATVQPRPIASPPSRPPTVPAAPRRPPPDRGAAHALAEPVQRATRDESGHAADGQQRLERDAAPLSNGQHRLERAAAVHAVEAPQGPVSRSPESAPVGLFGKSVRVSPPKVPPIVLAPPVPDDALPRPLSLGPPVSALAAKPLPTRPNVSESPAATPPVSEEPDAFPEPETIRSPSHGVVSLSPRQRWVRVAVVMGVLAALGAGLWMLRASRASSRTPPVVPSTGATSRVVPDHGMSRGTSFDA